MINQTVAALAMIDEALDQIEVDYMKRWEADNWHPQPVPLGVASLLWRREQLVLPAGCVKDPVWCRWENFGPELRSRYA